MREQTLKRPWAILLGAKHNDKRPLGFPHDLPRPGTYTPTWREGPSTPDASWRVPHVATKSSSLCRTGTDSGMRAHGACRCNRRLFEHAQGSRRASVRRAAHRLAGQGRRHDSHHFAGLAAIAPVVAGSAVLVWFLSGGGGAP